MAGILVTGMPRRVASARSMRSCVMFIDDTALRPGLAASTSVSTVSCSSDSRMSQRFTASTSFALSSTRLESALTSTSATARKRASALSAIGWVTKTRGRATTGSLVFSSRLYSGIDLGHHLFREQGHRALAELRIAPVLAGIEQCAEIADLL